MLFLRSVFAYIFFSGLLLLSRSYLHESEIWPFFHSWYAEEAKPSKNLSSNKLYDLNRRKNLKNRDKAPSIKIKDLSEDNDRTPELDFDGSSDFFIETPSIEEPIYDNKGLSKIDENFFKSSQYNTPGLGGKIADVQLRVFGNLGVTTSYGFASYLTEEDSRDDLLLANTQNIREDFFLGASLNLNLKGKIGRRVLIDINYDQNERLLNNKIQLKYFSLHKKEFIREVTFGNVDFDFPSGDSSNFEGLKKKNRETLGVEAKFQRGKFNFHSVATLTGGETETEIFTGKNRNSKMTIPEYAYEARRYFQLEPFIYYDGLSTPPTITRSSYAREDTNRLVTLTSTPKGDISVFTPSSVSIDSGSLEVWLDDRDTTNDQALNAQAKFISGAGLGSYHKLREPNDYQINYANGQLEFIRPIQSDMRIYVRYTRHGNGHDTADPSARTDVNGKIETFIYFGSSLSEDIDFNGSQDITIVNDGRINYDVYEVRSVYSLGSSNLQKNQFDITIVDRSRNVILGLNEQLGGYEVNFQRGLLRFYLREPFKAIKTSNQQFFLSDTQIRDIYSEIKINPEESSQIALQTNLLEETQNYKLRNPQIIKNSVRVKIDGVEIKSSLYRVDYLLGFLYFKDKNNPVILPSTRIEVTYQYSPFGQTTNGFILGLRSQYNANKDIQFGNTILYNAELQKNQAVRIGEAPASRFIIENDLKINLKEEDLTSFVNHIPGLDFDLLPVHYKFYGEYTNSFYNPNTVDVALVDDLESSEDRIEISVSDRDWQLSSLPPSLGLNECDRAPLFYRYYRDLNNLELGPTPLNAPVQASPPYSQLAGPYSVAEGHLAPQQLEQARRQISLVMDFDFSKGGKVASIVTRRFSPQREGRNLSQIEYIEFSAKLIDSAALSQGVSVRFDIGTINEDSDGDSRLDTEDVGSDGINNDINGDGIPDSGTSFSGSEHNGRIDRIAGGFTEDRGYSFNAPSACSRLNTRIGSGPAIPGEPRTNGNGVLNTEDLNGDGRLNTTENVIIFDELNRSYINFDTETGLNFSNIIVPGDWQLVRMYLNRGALSPAQQQLLTSVKSVRLYIVPHNNISANGRGRLLIDNIKFGSSRWRRKRLRINNTESDLTDSRIFSTSTIDNQDSRSEYADSSFIRQRTNEYEQIHGSQTNTERERTREAALKIHYDFTPSSCTTGVCQEAYVRRVFLRPLDLRYYKKINLWVNYRILNTPDDFFFLRFGSSDQDYIEVSKKMGGSGWRLLSFDIPEQFVSEICPTQNNFQGCPNLKQVNTMVLGIRNGSATGGNRGTIWVNDIFVSESNVQSDSSYKIKNYLHVIKPLYKTEGGTSILNDFQLSYEKYYQGNNFFTLNQAFNNISRDEDNITIRSEILPFWESNYLFSQTISESSATESQEQRDFDGRVIRVSHGTQHNFRFSNEYYPQITFRYVHQGRNIRKQEVIDHTTSKQLRDKVTQEDTYIPYISLHQNFPPFWGQKFMFTMSTSVLYFERVEDIVSKRSSQVSGSTQKKKSKEQKDEVDMSLVYQWRGFELKPSYFFRQVLLVNQSFTDNQTLNLIKGNFYFPFSIATQDFRYVQRLTKYKLSLRYDRLWIFSPKLEYLFNYLENSFRDNTDKSILSGNSFQRFKQPNSYARTNFSLDFDLQKISKKLEFFTVFSTSFFRDISLSENSVPFTAKSSIFRDEYGLSSRFQLLSNRVYDIFSHPVWQHFTSTRRHRNNFSDGREYVQKLNFRPVHPSQNFANAFSRYTQTIMLKEYMNVVANWFFFDGFTVLNEAHLSQRISRRGNISTIPSQIANWGVKTRPTIDLMKALNFWFWYTPSKDETMSQKNYQEKSSDLDIGFQYENNLLITNNLSREHYIPEIGISFNWLDHDNALQSFRIRTNLDLVDENVVDFFIANGNPIDIPIYETIQRSGNLFSKQDIGFGISILYTLGLPSVRRWLEHLTGFAIKKNPKYRLELLFDFNRFNYDIYTNLNRLPSDFYVLTQNFNMNIHTNVTGEIYLKSALEIQRDQETNSERRKVIAFEVGLSMRIIF